LLLNGAVKESRISPEDLRELFHMTALLNPMDGLDKDAVTVRGRGNADRVRLAGSSASSDRSLQQFGRVPATEDSYGSDEEERRWDNSVAAAMSEATVTQWKKVAATRKISKLRTGSTVSSYRAAGVATSLPPGWTTTMWHGEVYYWNCITGQTTTTPPGDTKTPTPKERWQQASAAVTAEPLDVALEELVRRREETRSLDESMPLEPADVDGTDEAADSKDEEAGLVSAPSPQASAHVCIAHAHTHRV
jgi:hypothetical protein